MTKTNCRNWLRRVIGACLCLALMAGWIPVGAAARADAGNWYDAYVTEMTQKGMILPRDGDAFCPDDNATRAVIVYALWVLAGQPEAASDAEFDDVPHSAREATAIRWAAQTGLVQGYGSGRFGPEDSVTREQFSVILLRYARIFGIVAEAEEENTASLSINDIFARSDSARTDPLNDFPDREELSVWAEEGVRWCVTEGLLQGRTDGSLDPGGYATRAELSALLSRYMEKVLSAADPGLVLDCDTPSGTVLTLLTPTLTGACRSKAAVGLSSLTWTLSSEGDRTAAGTLIPDSTGAWTLTDLRLYPGTNTLTLRAVDLCDRETILTTTLVYDSGTLTEIDMDHVAWEPVPEGESIGYIDNVVMVLLDPDLSADARNTVLQDLCRQAEATVIGSVNAALLYQLEVAPRDYASLGTLCDELMAQSGVLCAWRDLFAAVKATVPNDPWGEDELPDWDSDDPYGLNWWAEAVELLEARDIAREGTPVTLGIVDTGIDTDHEDLEGIRCLTDNEPMTHGTHVAGILAAAENNGVGITGLSAGSEVLSFDCYHGSNATTESRLIAAIARLLEEGARVINSSNAADCVTEEEAEDSGLHTALALRTLTKTVTEDFLIVMAAGNSAADARYSGLFAAITPQLADRVTDGHPQELMDHILVVAAAQYEFRSGSWTIAEFSDYGETVTLAAPGVNIYSTVCPKTDNGLLYDELSGTSMATPIVAGIAALIWQTAPELTAGQVREILLTSCAETACCAADGEEYPLVNAATAVKAAGS